MTTTTKMELVDIGRLIPYVNNARTHSPEQIAKLRSSLREFGFINPVLVDKDYNVIAGHGRIAAAKEEGLTKIPCVFVEHLTEVQKKAYILADNRMALDAGWDEDLLRIEIEELQGMDDPAEQRKMNGFLSRIAEQGAFEPEGYNSDDFDHQQLVHFAYLYCRFHQTDVILGAKDGNTFYYTLPLETVNEVLEQFFHLTLEEKTLRTTKDPEAESRATYSFYKKGYFFFPAEEVEPLSRVAIVREKTDLEEGLCRLDFDIYTVNTEESEGIPERIYDLKPAEAAAESELTKEASGVMTFRTYEKDGETRIYPIEYRVEENDA